jgi:hypothetical protein
MDVETLAICKKTMANVETATTAANEAATAANTAIASIFHDKNFLLSIQADNSLVLRYDPNETETEE